MKSMLNRRPLIGAKETADFLNISIETLYSWIYQKKVPYYKIGRLVKFDPQDLDIWLEERRINVFTK